jgi:Domain of unknown function (DUF1905)/Bacteriocin-protection, YdeI or OmpD-Associated
LVQFNTTIRQFAQQGEKTGWTYVEVPAKIATQLKPGNKKTFRVKGKLDNYRIAGIALIPMGGGNFIMALNASMRKQLRKEKGAPLSLQLEVDSKAQQVSRELLECLGDEPKALEFFNKLPRSHQQYFSKWIDGAKTEPTRSKRIGKAVTALAHGLHFGQMLRILNQNRAEG